jgi:hypothetical protein
MSFIAGYEWKAQGSKQVCYVAADFSVHELYRVNGQGWGHKQLIPPGAYKPLSISGFEWTQENSKNVVFHTPDGHIHSLVCLLSGWEPPIDLFDGAHFATGASVPLVLTSSYTEIFGYEWSAKNAIQIVYWGADGSLNEVSFASLPFRHGWAHTSLPNLTPYVIANSPTQSFTIGPTAYDWPAGATKQVLVIDGSGDLNWLGHSTTGGWSSSNLTQAEHVLEGYPTASASGMARFPGGANVVARTTYGGLISISSQPSSGAPWARGDLLQYLPASVGAINTGVVALDWLAGGYRQIYFTTEFDGHLHELYQKYGDPFGTWAHSDLTQTTGSTPVKLLCLAYEWTAGKSKQVVYIGTDGQLHELSAVVGQKWGYQQLTGGSTAPFSQAPSPVWMI